MATPAAGYSRTHIILHWVIAALVLFQLFVHSGMENAWIVRNGGVAEGANPLPHIIVGIAILLLAIWRVTLRLRNGAPAHPPGQPAVLTLLANATHILFYVLLFVLPLGGIAAWFGNIEVAAVAHVYIQLAFLPLIGLHVLGALVQQFWFRNGVLRRMAVPDRAL